DILDLLEFLISRFSNVDEAFRKIINTSDTKTPLITLRVFQAALVALDCGKFKGPDENQRLAAIFRYLDPGGEGSISQNEWRVLGQLWNEFDLTIREFVQFLQIAFGEDLQDAWEALDDDQSGELSEEEWFEAVEKIGYFGPARVIFALLDGSDDGDISVNEFQVLEKYKPKPKA
ncbi:Vti1b, partial [Symbiodinium sp. KB8]